MKCPNTEPDWRGIIVPCPYEGCGKIDCRHCDVCKVCETHSKLKKYKRWHYQKELCKSCAKAYPNKNTAKKIKSPILFSI